MDLSFLSKDFMLAQLGMFEYGDFLYLMLENLPVRRWFIVFLLIQNTVKTRI